MSIYVFAPLGYGLLGNRYGVEASIAVMGALILLTLPLSLLLVKPRVPSKVPSY